MRLLRLLERPDLALAYLSEWRTARKYASAIRPEVVRRALFFSYSRSGTHNFISRFHYCPSCFVIRENFFASPVDRFQLSADVTTFKSKPRQIMTCSVFGEHGVQNKQGGDLRHLFFFTNGFLRIAKAFPSDSVDFERDRVVFYFRNIFRTLYSQDLVGRRKKASHHFRVTEHWFDDALFWHMRKMREALALRKRWPESVAVVLHEAFCAAPGAVFGATGRLLGIPDGELECWNRPTHFFRRSYGSLTAPQIQDGHLVCATRRARIRGTGGSYNPLPEPSLSRTMGAPIAELMTGDRYSRACRLMGKDLTDFWLNDQGFPYGAESMETIVALMGTATSDNLPNLN
jgi:hypothetical protein